MTTPIEERDLKAENLRSHRANRRLSAAIKQSLENNRMLRDGQIVVKPASSYESCLCMIFADSLRLFDAILQLWRAGHLEAAAVVTRSLFERVVDALYLSKSHSARVRRYRGYWLANRHRYLSELQAELGPPKEDTENRLRKAEDLRRMAARHLRHYKEGQHWSGKGVRQRTFDVGLTRHYKLPYSEYCCFTHSDPVSAFRGVGQRRDYLTLRIIPGGDLDDYLAKMVETDAAKYQLLLFAVFANVFSMSLGKNLLRVINLLRKNEDFVECFRRNKVLWKSI